MTPQKQNKEMSKSFYLLIMLLPVSMFGLLGGFIGAVNKHSNFLSGFLWGVAIGLAICIVMWIGMFGWEWLKKEADKGKLLPYMLGGLVAAIAISGLLAINLGKPSCDEQGDAPYSSCTSYANDGFETNSSQRWNKFWETLPVTVIIGLLVAYIVHGQVEKNRPKHFRSERDKFTVSIFPETIGIDLDEDGNSYKYRPYDDIQFGIEVTPLEDFPTDQQGIGELVESWHRQVVSAATKVDVNDVEYSRGEKEHTPYLYSAYPLKKGLTYHQLTMAKYEKIYYLTMHLHASEHARKGDLDKSFFEFADSFHFI